MAFIHISKLDAAKRQLDTAINLFFKSGDPVSIHMLTSAAYDILMALANSQKIKIIMKDTSMVIKGRKKEFLDIMNKAQNFFKHGRRDATDVLEFNPESSTYFLWDAVRIYMLLTGERPSNMIAYQTWFFLKNPNILDPDQWKKAYGNVHSLYNPENRAEFFELIHILESQIIK